MTQKNAAEALAAYDALYKNPRTGEAIIDGDEAQVAADLAAAVRNLSRFEPSRIIEARRGGGAILVQLAGTDEEQIFLLESIAADIRGQQS